MIRITTAQLWVHDQDEALAFYTQKLGFEVRRDVTVPELGNFRWLTVGPPGQEDVAIVLMAIPGAPVMDAETAEEVRTLMGKGFAGTVFLTTDDIHATYGELTERGLEFTEAPRNARTASTRGSATRPATASGSRSSPRSRPSPRLPSPRRRRPGPRRRPRAGWAASGRSRRRPWRSPS